MRIIAGSLKGRKLTPPTDESIRPTSDRTRESIFNLLMHGHYGGDDVIGQHVMDLCCGTGAVGLEAISRGAERVTFIDQSRKALELARANALHCGVTSKCHFLQSDVRSIPATNTPAALAFMDAPYAAPLLAPAYAKLRAGHWLNPGALLVAELPFTQTPPVLPSADYLDMRKYGKATIHLWRITA